MLYLTKMIASLKKANLDLEIKRESIFLISSVQFSSIALSCRTLCYPVNHSTPGLPAHHPLPESTQPHVHWVGDAIQPSQPLSSPSPPTLNLPASGSFPMSQLSASDGQIIGVSASRVVPLMNTQDRFPLGLTGIISLQSKGLSRVFSSTTVWSHQFFGARPFLLSSSHICTWDFVIR